MPPNTKDPEVIQTFLLHMAEKVAARLRLHQFRASRFFVGLRIDAGFSRPQISLRSTHRPRPGHRAPMPSLHAGDLGRPGLSSGTDHRPEPGTRRLSNGLSGAAARSPGPPQSSHGLESTGATANSPWRRPDCWPARACPTSSPRPGSLSAIAKPFCNDD